MQLSCKSSCTLEEKVVRVHVQAKCRQKPPSSGPTAEGRILDTGLHVVLYIYLPVILSVYDLSHFRIRNDDGVCLENPKYVEPSIWFTEITLICSSYTSSATTLSVVHSSRHLFSTNPPACTSVDLVTGGKGTIKMQTSVEPLLSLGLLLYCGFQT